MLRRQFQVERVSRPGKWVSLLMVLQQSGLPFARRWQAELRARNWNGLLYVNVRDVMTVWARPKQASGAGR